MTIVIIFTIYLYFYTMKQERKIFHVYIKEKSQNIYFGSMKAIFSNLGKEDVGIVYSTLANYFQSSDNDIYENSKCRIIKSFLITQPKSD